MGKFKLVGRRDPNKLLPNEKMFVRELISARGNQTEAAIRVYTKKSPPEKRRHQASITGSKVMQRPRVQQEYLRQLEKMGLGDAALAEKLKSSIDVGFGVKATHKDSVAVLLAVAKMKGWLNNNSAHVRIDVKESLEAKPYQELLENYKKTHAIIDGMVNDPLVVDEAGQSTNNSNGE